MANGQPLLAKEKTIYIAYLNNGGKITIKDVPSRLTYSWINPKNGNLKAIGKVTSEEFTAPDSNPWALIIN